MCCNAHVTRGIVWQCCENGILIQRRIEKFRTFKYTAYECALHSRYTIFFKFHRKIFRVTRVTRVTAIKYLYILIHCVTRVTRVTRTKTDKSFVQSINLLCNTSVTRKKTLTFFLTSPWCMIRVLWTFIKLYCIQF